MRQVRGGGTPREGLIEMKWLAAVFVAGVFGSVAPASAVVSGQPGGPKPPQPLTVFPAGSFPESLAVRGGSLYVSLGFAGEVMRVSPTGVQTVYATGLPIGQGLLTGLAFDQAGNLYVAAATFSSDPAPGVYLIPAGGGSFSRVLTLPAESFPNGLAFHHGQLYVSDSSLGAIWKLQPGGATPTAPWYENALLAPMKGIGANGIAFDAAGNHLYVAVADSGRIVRLNLSNNGSVSSTTVVTEQQQLRSADGICFDTAGKLYVAVNDTNRLVRVDVSNGSLTSLADRSDGLSYPTQPAFDTSPESTTLDLTNGAFSNGVADIEAFNVGATGLPLS
jgi:sugar lactone lactonase YvrE